uniref:tRNA (cytosine(34)-C(5))-methyltransferase n=1 Tax=Timema genevievae TaxID=629358 RepID=A0A7R9JP51_TIMGE|nr:unnamed protein product [Timema genevievae]
MSTPDEGSWSTVVVWDQAVVTVTICGTGTSDTQWYASRFKRKSPLTRDKGGCCSSRTGRAYTTGFARCHRNVGAQRSSSPALRNALATRDVTVPLTLEKNKWDETAPRREPYQGIVRENPDFDKYYKMQKICSDEDWGAFMAVMKENLPTAFRITGSKSEAQCLLGIVKSELFKHLLNPIAEGEEPMERQDVHKPISIPWYPDNLAWQLTLTRKDIRRSEAYFRLHNFLINETQCGSISRQEVVSMIPPILLDVKSHHKVLDMCAAPGSKTSQLIELLHAEEMKLPTGLVVANDVDNNRCYMLVHQAKRLNSPCLIVTNHDSSVMPNFTVTPPDAESRMIKFDRVLCDVPCSGDGTLRKNPDIWLKWNSANGNNLHGIQYRIVRRGVEILSVGGRLVYSTCSLNPLENEAVIHRLLTETEGALHLVEATPLLPGLKFSRGLSHWLPTSRDLVGYQQFEDVPDKYHTVVRPQIIRILPHQQDTGGFFVAVLEKLGSLPWEAAPAKDINPIRAPGDPIPPRQDREPQRKKRKLQTFREDPFIFFTEDEPLWPSIRDFYDLSAELLPSMFMVRCKEGKKKNIYFTSPIVRDIVINNNDKLKIINTGVKTFVRCDNKGTVCSFRLAQEGLHSIFPLIGPKRKVHVTKEDMVTLLRNDSPHYPPEFHRLQPSTQEQFLKIEQGSCVLVCETDSGPNTPPLSLVTVGWRGAKSARAYVSNHDCVHYLRLCGADVSQYEVKKTFKDKPPADDGSSRNETDDKDPEDVTMAEEDDTMEQRSPEGGS